MKSLQLLSGSALLLCVLVLAGCDKTVTVTWINGTMETKTVDLQGPDIGREQFVVAPNGGKVPVKVKIPKDELPATYQWSAGGDCRGQFTITEKTDSKLNVIMGANGPHVIDSKTTLHEKSEKNVAPTPVAPPREVVE